MHVRLQVLGLASSRIFIVYYFRMYLRYPSMPNPCVQYLSTPNPATIPNPAATRN